MCVFINYLQNNISLSRLKKVLNEKFYLTRLITFWFEYLNFKNAHLTTESSYNNKKNKNGSHRALRTRWQYRLRKEWGTNYNEVLLPVPGDQRLEGTGTWVVLPEGLSPGVDEVDAGVVPGLVLGRRGRRVPGLAGGVALAASGRLLARFPLGRSALPAGPAAARGTSVRSAAPASRPAAAAALWNTTNGYLISYNICFNINKFDRFRL